MRIGDAGELHLLGFPPPEAVGQHFAVHVDDLDEALSALAANDITPTASARSTASAARPFSPTLPEIRSNSTSPSERPNRRDQLPPGGHAEARSAGQGHADGKPSPETIWTDAVSPSTLTSSGR